jgi:3-dehydroquinate synthase
MGVLHELTVDLGTRSYAIRIGSALLDDAVLLGRTTPARQLLLVSNVTIAPLYAQKVQHALRDRQIVEAWLPDGESHKTLANVSRLLDTLVTNRFSRDACVMALGGGVVGDIAGFAAACYQRGIDCVQLPTTLLSQVDSSVGGKTGVNHPGGKNLIGAFHQPREVLIDTDTLATLPDRELRAGLAEVIKYGVIANESFFAWLEKNIAALLARDSAALAHAIKVSCATKAAIVARDEREQGDRALLNFGHTFGHAIETATEYQGYLHGEAVAAGMATAASAAARLGWLPAASKSRIHALIAAAGLPLQARDVPAARAAELMRIDKKVKAGRIRLVLPRRIGECVVTADFDGQAVDAALQEHFA